MVQNKKGEGTMKKTAIMATLLMAFMMATPIYAVTTYADTTPTPTPSPTLKPTWFMMTGLVNSYGGAPAHGSLWSCGKNGSWAMANAFFAPGNWTWMDGNWLCVGGPEANWMWTPRNYTYSFCTVSLVNTSLVALNYTKGSETYDLYISGLWNVWNNSITYVFTKINVTKTFNDINFTFLCERITPIWSHTPLALNATGELYVTGNWLYTPPISPGAGGPTFPWISPLWMSPLKWNLNITSVAPIAGQVVFYRVRPLRPIPLGDVWGPNGIPTGNVTLLDLVHVARAYGSTPGMPNYDFNCAFDFNVNQQINIFDLTTVAANLGQSY
jgi:hypothetical protein